ncbi:hypothetical protein NUW58_g6804 [Xylaria curta]|uniref:Uncharacterized protein n=1 Tax=Xylaria curta TaxID=42375 RepID=A0ACC1NPX9_9PEZI|nr:hypothetical protein NUW58_g6804 [Xylaria curta]
MGTHRLVLPRVSSYKFNDFGTREAASHDHTNEQRHGEHIVVAAACLQEEFRKNGLHNDHIVILQTARHIAKRGQLERLDAAAVCHPIVAKYVDPKTKRRDLELEDYGFCRSGGSPIVVSNAWLDLDGHQHQRQGKGHRAHPSTRHVPSHDLPGRELNKEKQEFLCSSVGGSKEYAKDSVDPDEQKGHRHMAKFMARKSVKSLKRLIFV